MYISHFRCHWYHVDPHSLVFYYLLKIYECVKLFYSHQHLTFFSFLYAILTDEELLRMRYLVIKNSGILPSKHHYWEGVNGSDTPNAIPSFIHTFLKRNYSIIQNVKRNYLEVFWNFLRLVDVVYTLRWPFIKFWIRERGLQ